MHRSVGKEHGTSSGFGWWPTWWIFHCPHWKSLPGWLCDSSPQSPLAQDLREGTCLSPESRMCGRTVLRGVQLGHHVGATPEGSQVPEVRVSSKEDTVRKRQCLLDSSVPSQWTCQMHACMRVCVCACVCVHDRVRMQVCLPLCPYLGGLLPSGVLNVMGNFVSQPAYALVLS